MAGIPVPYSVQVRDVWQPRHLSSLVTAISTDNTTQIQGAIQTVYTGIIRIDFDESNDRLATVDVASYILMNDDDRDDYFRDNKLLVNYSEAEHELIDIVASANVSVFTGNPLAVLGVDSVSAGLETHLFKDARKRRVLVINVEATIQLGKIYGITYNVTTLSRFPGATPKTFTPRSQDQPGLTI